MVRRQKEYHGHLRQLALMRALLRETCHEVWRSGPADEKLILRLTLALTEAASNIILHGFDGQPDQSIGLTVEVEDDQARVMLKHKGKPFDPQSAAAPAFDGSRESGFGLYLIRKSVDEVRYYQDDEGLCVMRLVQNRKQSDKGAGHGTDG